MTRKDPSHRNTTETEVCREFHIVGIGASAGGLEALETLFDEMPSDTGMAFVVVQHLSPDFKSHMPELLSRHTDMPIHRVENDMTVKPNTVYLIPPKMEMVIAGGRLLITEKSNERTLSHPIDQFFRSLASDVRRYSIGVILSGTGSDGSRGIVDIHDAGGLVVAQKVETAAFDGMPMNALATGVVDLVLPPAEVAEALVKYVKDGLSPEAVAQHDLWAGQSDDVERIFELLQSQHGLDFSKYKSSTVDRRIQRRVDLLEFVSLQDYIQHLSENASELNELYKDLLIGVTKFFRDPEAFAVIENEIVPKLFRSGGADAGIRMWIAGCASGEEAYSLAMLVDDEMRRRRASINVKIFATDVHHVSLHAAAKGVFPEEALSELTEARRSRYFIKKRDGFHVVPEIRKHVIFAPHNVIGDAPFTQMDLVSCRNLLIYLQPSAQRKAMSLFHFALKAGGTLFLGPSESPGELADEFKAINKRWRIYTKWRDVRLPLAATMQIGGPGDRLPRAAVTPAPTATPSVDHALLGTYDRLLDRKMPPSVLVNEKLEILHVFGGAERFIRSKGGRRTNLLLDVVDVNLKTPLTGALQHAIRKQDVVKYTGIRLTVDDDHLALELTVEPIVDPDTKAMNLLVEFVASDQASSSHDSGTVVDVSAASKERIAALESELRYAQENLQATIEEMETANEELQATNEELVASNEELQSTNEELHSVNEELYTVNAEHQRRVEELAEANNDMDNLLATTRVGVVYLDEELFIRRYTPEIARVLHLLPHDVGRSIEGFVHHFNHEGLVDDLKEVYSKEQEKEIDILARDGTAYLLRILPYRSNGNVSGIVLTLIDVGRLRRTQAKLERFMYMSEAAVDMHALLDSQGQFTYTNPAFCKTVGHDADALRGMTVADVDLEFDIPRYRALFEKLGDRDISLFESTLEHRNGQQTPVEISVSAVVFDDQKLTFASLRNIADRRAAEQEIRLHKAGIDAAANGVIITDHTRPDEPISYVNAGFCRMTGYTEDEVVGHNCRFLQGEDTDPASVALLRDAIASGKECRVLLKNYRKDGKFFWNDLVLTPIERHNGQVTHFVGIQNDVTARVETMTRMQAVFDTTVEGIYGVDLNGMCTFVNRAATTLLGFEREDELIGQHMHSLIHHHHADGQHYEQTRCPIYRAFHENETVHVDDEVFWRKDGTKFPAEYWSQPMVREGATQGAVVTFLDITARRQAGERMDRLGRMVDASHDAIIVWNEDNGIQSWNVGAVELYGFSPDEAIGQVTHDLLKTRHPIPFSEIREIIDRDGEWTGIVQHFTKDGQARLISTRHQLWRSHRGEIAILEINRDVTDEQRIRQELQRTQERAEQANAAKSEFLANMSHELRTPMTAVLGFADMLGAELNDDAQLEKVQTIARNGEYLLALLNDILDLSKIEAGKMVILKEPVDLIRLVADVRSLMMARAEHEGIPFSLRYESDVPAHITGDPVRIRQILVNLVANALKFTDEGDVKLMIRLERNGDAPAHLHFDVVDTGIGMTALQQQALFRPFSQATRQTAQKFGGTGLGLSISKRLADELGGHISVESKIGRGSQFRLVLPVTVSEAQALVSPDEAVQREVTTSTSMPAPAGPTLDARVLLADDRRDVWRVVKYFLENSGADVTVAEDGRQAVDEANRARTADTPYDIILMDMHMPVMSGKEAVIALRKQGFDVPIVALTADAMSGNRETCIEFGCTDYFPKPVDGPLLVDLVDSLLASGRETHSS